MAVVNNGVLIYKTKPIAYNTLDNKISLNGEDVAKILEFAHPLYTLAKLLEPEDRYLSQGSVFIYESGIYTLITHSKNKEISREFKKWVINEIGKKKNEQFEEIRRYSLRLKNKDVESRKKKKEEIVYISSSVNYAKQHRFKIGGVSNQELLAKRLSAYDGRSAKGDEWGICRRVNVSNFRQFEKRFWDILSDFRDKPKKEIIKMFYNDLEEVFLLIAEHYNKEIDFVNNRLLRYIENINYNKIQPFSPKLERFEKIKVKKAYITLPTDDELRKEIEKYMMDKKSSSTTPSVVFLKSDVIKHCIEKFKKFSRRSAWKIMKKIGEEHKDFRLIYS